MNILTTLRTQFDLARTALLSRAGTLDNLTADLSRLQTRALAVAEASNEKANNLENQVAALQSEIAHLDLEQDEASLIAVGAGRLLGK